MSDGTARLRVCTFNVHGWRDTRHQTRTDDVIALLAGLDADVIALNEVVSIDHALLRVADALGMRALVAEGDFGWNALLTRAPVQGFDVVALGGARSQRSALCATLETPLGALDVVVTHLDYAEEARRLDQLGILLAALAPRPRPRVVMGDLNAMWLPDYPPGALAALHATRADHGWEPARDDVVRALLGAGYVDAVRLAEAGDLARYAAALAEPIAEAHRATSRVATRIDYVWLDAALARTVTARDARTLATDASDHVPVVVTLVGGAG